MARYTTTVETPMAQEAAFAYMADLRNFERWDPGVSSAELIQGDGPGPGATYRVEASGVTLEYETWDYRHPSEVYVVASNALLESRDRITVEPDQGHRGGSVVTYDAELRLKGPLVLLDPLLGLAFGRIGDKAAAGLRREIGHGAGRLTLLGPVAGAFAVTSQLATVDGSPE